MTLELDRGLVDVVLSQETREADLLVLGHRRDRPLVQRLVSPSVALTVLEHARCPVVIVPEPASD